MLKFTSFCSQMINVFGLYWGLFFFTAFGELVLAGVFAEVNILPMHICTLYAHSSHAYPHCTCIHIISKI